MVHHPATRKRVTKRGLQEEEGEQGRREGQVYRFWSRKRTQRRDTLVWSMILRPALPREYSQMKSWVPAAAASLVPSG